MRSDAESSFIDRRLAIHPAGTNAGIIMSKSQPAWDTAARIDGLPCTNWKKRTGVTLEGTLDECITRWLDLAGHQQSNCTLGWGPTAEGDYGSWSASAIGSYVRRNGLPPA